MHTAHFFWGGGWTLGQRLFRIFCVHAYHNSKPRENIVCFLGIKKVAGSLISVFRQILSFQNTFSFCGNGMKEDIIVPDRFICLQINSAANIYVFSGGECVLSFFGVANPDHFALLGSKSCSD